MFYWVWNVPVWSTVWRKLILWDNSHSSTTMRLIEALWFLYFSFGLRPKQMYSPPSSKVILDSRMETLCRSFFPTNCTRSRYIETSGTESSDFIVELHTWKQQESVKDLKKVRTRAETRLSVYLPSGCCRCYWTASWSKGFWCPCSWSRRRAAALCCHSLPPDSWSSIRSSQGHETSTNLQREEQWQENQSKVVPVVFSFRFLGLMQFKACLHVMGA